jgi:hypothetical protein
MQLLHQNASRMRSWTGTAFDASNLTDGGADAPLHVGAAVWHVDAEAMRGVVLGYRRGTPAKSTLLLNLMGRTSLYPT